MIEGRVKEREYIVKLKEKENMKEKVRFRK